MATNSSPHSPLTGQPLAASDAATNSAANGATPLTCTSCGNANPLDSRFCRHCGATLAPDTSVAAPVVPAPVVSSGSMADAASAGDEMTRARQLWDRAFALAERGDMQGAILACRQGVALAPDAPQGFSMLGLLLERSGNLEQAAAAYRRVLVLAPDSRLEAESLARLQSTLVARRGPDTQFQFDANDLKGVQPPVAPNVNSAAVSQSTPFDTLASKPQAVATVAPLASPQNNAGAVGLGIPSVGALHFDNSNDVPAPLWARVANNPTFFFRGLPLAGATALGVMFLMWARGAAVSRDALATANAAAVDTPALALPGEEIATTNIGVTGVDNGAALNAPQPNVAPPSAVGGLGPNQPYPVSNRAPINNNVAPAASPNAPTNNSSGGGSGANNRPSNNGAGGTIPRPATAARPVPSFPSAPRISPAVPGLLPPVRSTNSSSAPESVAAQPYNQPSTESSNIASSGGSPLNPSGNGSRGYINLTRPRTVAPTQPRQVNRANEAERAAAQAGRSGRSDNAINNMNVAIQGGETGYRYQQRALLFLERGDNQRAADDFQTAIAAYQDQIRRGENTGEAQAGINACRSGLRLALANLRR